MKAYLVFEDGETFQGEWIGTPKTVSGEVVFTTGMTGYQEVMTDPSYAGQIVIFTYPMIGNYGLVAGESESHFPPCTGVVMSECYHEKELGNWLDQHGVPGITGVDTRAVVKKIRAKGAMRGQIHSNPIYMELREVLPDSIQWVQSVSVDEPVFYKASNPHAPHVLLIDFGYKASILGSLQQLGCKVTVVPWHWSVEEILKLHPDGLLFSNGPGDPKALIPWLEGWKSLAMQLPTLGICLGHQVLAMAFGARTKRLPFGHRGSNHPVRNQQTGEVWITSQNHGYTVCEDSLDPGQWIWTHIHGNDGSVEGLMHQIYPVTTVQFHPEAHPGPSDAAGLFHQFVEQVMEKKEVKGVG
ncbi:carbamoyl phosphate synthase small subunit [Marininema halotolerans]|uniref:Carbamoyl phosphate synthase small chain n=1 Tax=Marininema halotolerans TaxID=1155944 RepID=A0A1I6NZ42_9BACL|nr:carbamoyl phosphate synthase small subunit [Marininema halotolerans]SFS33189.1 carbamoyl-phosphate synthase small subunit [Marininema halotolerans]